MSTKNKPIRDDCLEELVTCARQARARAYAPYSRYAVGAAVLGRSGKIYGGCNVENAAFPSGLCAERVAIFKAISEGERHVVAMAVVTTNLGAPCGACRQVLSEFASEGTEIILAGLRGTRRKRFTLESILPERFTKQDLE